jgi:hypothetical protein
MIVREPHNGEAIVVGQTDHSRFVGQLAAHWGNDEVARPDPWESVVRAAIYHDYGWITYETHPLVNEETGAPYKFLELPLKERQLESYQWCIDWMAGTDIYSALIISRHRTGLWKGRYGFIDHPQGVSLDLCERVTQHLAHVREEYALEVSSPGPRRPLTKPDHFRRFVGRRARVPGPVPATSPRGL